MDILVKAGQIIDGTGADPIKKGAVLISGNKILQVGRQSEIKESGVDVLDAGNKTVVPGFFDCHVHTCGTFSQNFGAERYLYRNMTNSILGGVYNCRKAIAAGVTTIKDVGCGHNGIFVLRDQINSGRILGPRILASGRVVVPTGGHGFFSGMWSDGPVEVRKAVRWNLLWGADCIKLMVTGGAAGNYEKLTDTIMDLDEIVAGVKEAKKKQKRTSAHCCNPEAALLCVEGGVDSIDHGNILDIKALSAMKRAGTFYVPTMITYKILAEATSKVGHSEIAYSEITHQKCKEILPIHRESFQNALKMGVNIAGGTDTGHLAGPMGEPTISEMEIYVDAGMTPMEAIKSSTYMAARNCGIEESVGTLEKGKLADLVIVDGDPLENISNLKRVWRVMKEGKIVHEG